MTIKHKRITVEKDAAKFIKKQDNPTREEFKKAIKNLPKGDVKEMIGFENTYRLKPKGKLRNFRIIFNMIEDEIVIDIIVEEIGNRGEIYRHYKK